MAEIVQSTQARAILGGYLLRCERRSKGNQESEKGISKEPPEGEHRKCRFTRSVTKPKHTGHWGWALGELWLLCKQVSEWPGLCDSDHRTPE